MGHYRSEMMDYDLPEQGPVVCSGQGFAHPRHDISVDGRLYCPGDTEGSFYVNRTKAEYANRMDTYWHHHKQLNDNIARNEYYTELSKLGCEATVDVAGKKMSCAYDGTHPCDHRAADNATKIDWAGKGTQLAKYHERYPKEDR